MNIEFRTARNLPFERMAMDAVVPGISFEAFMVKLKHADRSWAKDL